MRPARLKDIRVRLAKARVPGCRPVTAARYALDVGELLDLLDKRPGDLRRFGHGLRIRDARKRVHMSLGDLAEATGVSLVLLSDAERGLKPLSKAACDRVALALNVDRHFIRAGVA